MEVIGGPATTVSGAMDTRVEGSILIMDEPEDLCSTD